MKDGNKNTVNGEIINLINIYQSKGSNQLFWELTLFDINKKALNKQIVDYLAKHIKGLREIDLTLDIIDFIMDNCTNNKIIDLISQKNFIDSIIFLLKAYINSSTKAKILFLIKKWAKKFETTFPIYNEKYNKLYNEGFKFPAEVVITYKKYVKNDIKNDENFFDINNNNDKFSLDNIEFPEDEFSNQFSNLRTSEIPDYFKNLQISRKSTMEQKYEKNQNNNTKNNTNKNHKNNANNKIITNNNKTANNQKNKINDNNIQNSIFEKYNDDPIIFENIWKDKIKNLNKWINDGTIHKYKDSLKEDIKEFINELKDMDEIILKCGKIGDDKNRDMVSNIKSDMEQTCYRFECVMKDIKVEKFKSAFEGNSKKYEFNAETIFDEQETEEKKIQKEKRGTDKFSFSRNMKDLFKVGKNKGCRSQEDFKIDIEKKDKYKEKEKNGKEKEKEKKDKKTKKAEKK